MSYSPRRHAPWLLLLAGLLLAAPGRPSAPTPGHGPATLPDFDLAGSARGATLPQPTGQATAHARGAVRPGVRVLYDALTGSASRVWRPGGTLTRPSRLAPEASVRSFVGR